MTAMLNDLSAQLPTFFLGDSLELMKGLPSDYVELILSDIPYGIGAEDWDVLHQNTNSAYRGTSPAQEISGAIFKSRGKPINGWSEADRAIPQEYYDWCSQWAGEWLRVLKPGASAIVFAGRRLAHRCSAALEDAGFSLKDTLAWLRPKAAHRAQRLSVVYERRGDRAAAEEWQHWRLGNLRPTFEPILWFQKPYVRGGTIASNAKTHGVGAFNQEAFIRYAGRPDNVIEMGFSAGENGLHPTQKPVLLMQALIELTTKEGSVILDPFCGSGSTIVAAQNLSRKGIGFDNNQDYIDIANSRIEHLLI